MFKPIGDKLSVRKLKADEKTKGGIYLQQKDDKKPQEGIVIELGEGRLVNNVRQPYLVKEGDKIIFDHTSGTKVTLDNEEILILAEEEILAVVK